MKIVFIYITKLLCIPNGTLTSNIHHCCQHFDKLFLYVKFKIKENNKRYKYILRLYVLRKQLLVITYMSITKIKISVDRLNLSHYFSLPQRKYITVVANFLLNDLVSKFFTYSFKEKSERKYSQLVN